MSANFNAEIYASKTRTANANLNSELYATADPLLYSVNEEFEVKRTLSNEVQVEADTIRIILQNTTVNLIPELYASIAKSAHATLYGELYSTADPLLYRVNAEFNTKRTIENDNPQIRVEFDARRVLSNKLQVEVDTKRSVLRLIHTEINADTKRTITYFVTPNFDTLRTVESNLLQVLAVFDTKRAKTNGIEIYFDTKRSKNRIVSIEFDTKRQIKDIVYEVEAFFDTERTLEKTVMVEFDTLRSLPIFAKFDTKRQILKNVEIHSDTMRQIPHNFDKIAGSGVQSIFMTLATNTLSDTFTLTGINPIYPLDEVKGVLLDFPYLFRAEEVREEGILFTVNKATYNTTKMIYTLYNYTLKSTDRSISSIFNEIAEKIGFKSEIMVHNEFNPSVNYSNQHITYQSLISALFSWSENIPQKKFIIFLRNRDTLYCFQRGSETGNINLDEYKWYNNPSYTRKLIRTVWMKSTDGVVDTDRVVNKVVQHPKGIRYIFPGAPPALSPWDEDGWKYGWADGVVPPSISTQTKAVSRSDGKTDNRINKVTRLNHDGSTTTVDYFYITTKRGYLISEIHEATEKKPYTNPATGIESPGYRNEKKTCYEYLPGGIRHIIVYVNHKKIEETEDHYDSDSEEEHEEEHDSAENAFRGRPGDEGNEFTDDQSSLSYGGSWNTGGTSSRDTFLQDDDDIPVSDEATRQMYWRELEWLNGSIQETVTFTITAPVKNGVIAEADNHVFDFFDTYTLNGKVYFLESNNVTFTPRSLKQQLTLIRWYKVSEEI